MSKNSQTRPRKRPTQARAQEKVARILDATRALLRADGYEVLTTNKVAARAAVPVGSVYQYFPNKDALVVALIEEHTSAMVGLFNEVLERIGDAPLEEAVRVYVDALLRFHQDDPALHHVRFAQSPRLMPAGGDLNTHMQKIVSAFLHTRGPELDDEVRIDVASFILVTAVEAVTARAVRPDAALPIDLVVDETTRMITRYLRG